jgi:DNA replication and repair protein RecF
LTAQDGRPPLLLLDDVFSELDPERRSHLVRRIAALPQSFVTTTTLADLDPGLVAAATPWEVIPDGPSGARLAPSGVRVP